jgi:hypothetical protein
MGMGMKLGRQQARSMGKPKSKKRKSSKRKSRLGRYYAPGYQDIYHTGLKRPKGGLGIAKKYAKPITGGLEWMRSREALWGMGGVVAGDAIANITTAAVGKWVPVLKDQYAKDKDAYLPNLAGDLVGAIVAWEAGKRIDNSFATFSAATAATRFLRHLVHKNVLQPAFGADGFLKNMSAEAPTTLGAYNYTINGLGQRGRGYTAPYGNYTVNGMGQVRIPDATTLGQVRVPDYQYMSGLGQVRTDSSNYDHFDTPYSDEATLFG